MVKLKYDLYNNDNINNNNNNDDEEDNFNIVCTYIITQHTIYICTIEK